ncbi:MAG: metallophosphoesterase [Oscillospiraceae bacterium]|nr:metallophosphoesterase [Oscillospiraceae bacterium]
MEYPYFIPQNVALSGTRRISVFNKKGARVGQIRLDTLTPPTHGQKLYSFGALSDLHIPSSTAEDDFKRALTYLNDVEGVAFTCICGDITDNGSESELAKYKAIVNSHSPDAPVYAIAGNHEAYYSTSSGYLQNYTGKPGYYKVEHKDDVFLMLGILGPHQDNLFTDDELDWFESMMNQYASKKRVFVFQHIFAPEGCGDALGIYPYLTLNDSASSTRFKNILRAHPNAIWFHGHSHMKFYLQQYSETANYDRVFGCHSVHIPSITVPRDQSTTGEMTMIYSDSEGYVVDVYENGIHLRGRNFVYGEFLPIASYWIDTP